jgi:glyoxylase-like metal-dependent hydrolase (beta-lactamase superfamily II)
MKVANRWFDRKIISDEITLLWEPHVVPLMRCNIWHVRGRDRDLMIDTGMGVASLVEAAKDLLQKPVTAVATHTHTDHVGGHHEFSQCLVHKDEAGNLGSPSKQDNSLFLPGIGSNYLEMLQRSGYECNPGESLITALPHAHYDMHGYCVKPAPATVIVDEGDVVDLGNRHFEVLHLPGHSPGSIGLWEKKSGILFSGDCVYDGPLLDELSDSDIGDYIASMKKLRDLPVQIVHAGHDPSFGGERLLELIDAYLVRRDLNDGYRPAPA